MSDSFDDDEKPRTPYWRLLAILGASTRLEPKLAYWLYDSAVELHDAEGSTAKLTSDGAEGELRCLDRHVLLGSIGGPTFEATLDAASGREVVRFLVTQQGLEEHRKRTALTSKLVN